MNNVSGNDTLWANLVSVDIFNHFPKLRAFPLMIVDQIHKKKLGPNINLPVPLASVNLYNYYTISYFVLTHCVVFGPDVEFVKCFTQTRFPMVNVKSFSEHI